MTQSRIHHVSILIIIHMITLFLLSTVQSSKQTMVWMCLERCKETSATILKHLDTIEKVAPKSLTAVSFELYDLGNNSNIVRNPSFSSVFPALKKMNGFENKPLRLLPMITTTKIDWMRILWNNSDPFIKQCIDEAKSQGYSGYNIDWEPEHGVVAQDAQLYTTFLTKFMKALNDNNLELNVDVASWSVLYNFTDIGNALNVGTVNNRMLTMDTYAGPHDTWFRLFQRAFNTVPDRERLGIGLMTVNPNDGKPLNDDDLSWRFGYIKQYSIQEVDIWLMDGTMADPSSIWWNYLEAFLKNQ
jgi:hypothetical protein